MSERGFTARTTPMTWFVVQRAVRAAVVLLCVSVGLAFLLDLSPGDPAYAIAGDRATPEQIAQIHEDLRLDDPVVDRYASWLGDVVRGDLGTSYKTKRSVAELITERLPVTVELVVLALVGALVTSVPLGILAASRAGGPLDKALMSASSAVISIPPFVVALVLVYVFAVQLKDLPIGFPATGWVPLGDGIGRNLLHASLPAATLSLILIPPFMKLLRDDMVATLKEDFILAARAKGLRKRTVLVRHALRPSSFSLVTLAAQSVGLLIGGAVVVEVLFALPGMGQLLVDSINSRDVTAVQGIVAFIAIVYVVVNIVVDIVYGFLDPRVRARVAAR